MTTSISGLSGAQGSNGGEQTSAEAQGQPQARKNTIAHDSLRLFGQTK